MKTWFKSGQPWIWLSGGAIGICLVAVIGLLLLIAVRGLSYFWPSDIQSIVYVEQDGSEKNIIAEIYEETEVEAAQLRQAGMSVEGDDLIPRYLLKTGNRELYGLDFRTVIQPGIKSISQPEDIVVLERTEWGNFYGYIEHLTIDGEKVDQDTWQALEKQLERADTIRESIHHVERSEIGAINYQLEKLRLKQRRYELEHALTPEVIADLEEEKAVLNQQYSVLMEKLGQLYTEIRKNTVTMREAEGTVKDINIANIVSALQPNQLGVFGKLGAYFGKIGEFLLDEPREANTEGGVFPAIFGTVMMVLLMAVVVTPFGVISAIYLREYAKQGPITRLIRISVINLAGVPSIVYGVFGLGFFVYFLGGSIDALFYPEALPAPTFGTPGLFWSSLTLALLTVPVVIVATEEGLARIPRAIREGSLALGATKAETLWRVVIPMSSPAMMTGLILAVARAAGEVAPLMLVGVVKLAPTLPLDGNFPFLHLDRKFMHLGFHIYDVGFQSPNVEAARPLVYATAFLLVLVIVLLNLAAISIRNRLREKYKALES